MTKIAQLIALAPLVLLLLAPRAALADPNGASADTDKPASNMETMESPASASGHAPGPSPTAIVAPGVPSQPETEPSTALDPDAPITEQLHNLANGRFDRIIGSTKKRESIDAFYASRNYAPLWITQGKANARAEAAIAYLGGVSADGLDPTDYPVPNFASLTDAVGLAEAEITLTTSAITYAHHAQIGRVHWSRVSGDIFYDQSAPDPGEVLATIVQAKDVGEALDAYEPHAEGYPRPPDYSFAYPPPDTRYGYGWTWNDCPPGWTEQGGNCVPYGWRTWGRPSGKRRRPINAARR